MATELTIETFRELYDETRIAEHRSAKLESLLRGKLSAVKREYGEKLARVEAHLDRATVDQVLSFAEAQDYGQGEYTRYYITHPIRVAGFCCDWMALHGTYSTEFLSAALIHNVFEKDVLSPEECRERYGDWIFRVVEAITPDREALKTRDGKIAYYGNVRALPPMGQLLKFFDKFDNVYALCLNPDEQTRREYLDEVCEFVHPIAQAHFPEILPYFDALVSDTRRIGYFKPGPA